MHLAASHAFPPDYVKRLNELWLAPLERRRDRRARRPCPRSGAARPPSSPTRCRTSRSARGARWRPSSATGRSSRPRSSSSGEVLGALNGYSARPRTLTAAQLQTVETLASQAALALRLTMLVEAQQETIDQLREANEQLREHRRMLERSHDIHLRLTSAVIAGADFHAVAQTLAGLIGRGVLVTDAGGRPICTSEDPPPRPRALTASPDALVGRIRIGAELLGHVVVEEGDPARATSTSARSSTRAPCSRSRSSRSASRARRKSACARTSSPTSSRAATRPSERIGERARHYGLSLGAEHRVVVVALEDGTPTRSARGCSEAGGRDRRGADPRPRRRDARRARAGRPHRPRRRHDDRRGADRRRGGRALARVTGAIAAWRARVAEVVPGLRVSAGIGAPARAAPDFRASYAGATRCIDVLRRLGRAGRDARRRRPRDPRPVRRQRAPGGARGARTAGARPGAGPRRADGQRAAAHARELPRVRVRRARVRARPLRPRRTRCATGCARSRTSATSTCATRRTSCA